MEEQDRQQDVKHQEAIEGERPREFKCDGCGVVFAPKGKKLYTYWSKIRDGTFRHAFCSRECVCEYNIVEYGKPATVGTCCDCGSEFTRATKEGSRKLSAAIRMGANVYCVSCRGARAGKRNGNSVRSRLHQKIVDTGYKCALSGVTLTPSTSGQATTRIFNFSMRSLIE